MSCKFHSLRSGKEGAKRVLCLHGFTGDCRDWQPIFDFLGDTADMLAVDLPGHGQTECDHDDDHLMPNAAEHLHNYLHSISFLPCHLVGYSMGGRLALYMLLNYPDSFHDSILESASPGLKTESEREARRKLDEARAKELELSSLTHFLTKWYDQPLFESMRARPKEFKELLGRRLMADKSGWVKSLRFMGTGRQPSLWEKLPELSRKVRLIVGKNDGKFRAIGEQMSAESKRFELSQIDCAGHNIHFEQPKQFADQLREFLEL